MPKAEGVQFTLAHDEAQAHRLARQGRHIASPLPGDSVAQVIAPYQIALTQAETGHWQIIGIAYLDLRVSGCAAVDV